MPSKLLSIDKCEFGNSVINSKRCDILLLQETLLTNDKLENTNTNFNAMLASSVEKSTQLYGRSGGGIEIYGEKIPT